MTGVERCSSFLSLAREAVQQQGKGGLVVGGQIIGPRNAEDSRDAALECLQTLHRCQLLHREVEFRNREVGWAISSSEEENFLNVAFWIDFGYRRLE